MKIKEVNFDEFLEMLGIDDVQGNEAKEMENEIEVTIVNEVKEIITGMRTCTTAMKTCLENRGAKYHQAISEEIGRTLTEEETALVDTAFQYAFIDGWHCHKANGESNDK